MRGTRPYQPGRLPKVPWFLVRVPREARAQLGRLAKASRVSLGQVVALAVDSFLAASKAAHRKRPGTGPAGLPPRR